MELNNPYFTINIQRISRRERFGTYLEIQLPAPYQPTKSAYPSAKRGHAKCDTHQFGSLRPASELVLR